MWKMKTRRHVPSVYPRLMSCQKCKIYPSTLLGSVKENGEKLFSICFRGRKTLHVIYKTDRSTQSHCVRVQLINFLFFRHCWHLIHFPLHISNSIKVTEIVGWGSLVDRRFPFPWLFWFRTIKFVIIKSILNAFRGMRHAEMWKRATHKPPNENKINLGSIRLRHPFKNVLIVIQRTYRIQTIATFRQPFSNEFVAGRGGAAYCVVMTWRKTIFPRTAPSPVEFRVAVIRALKCCRRDVICWIASSIIIIAVAWGRYRLMLYFVVAY